MNELAGLSVQGAGAVSPAERHLDLHPVRPADSAAGRSESAAAVSRWIDPATGRVWGSPNSQQLAELSVQAARDEQEARATRLTREEAWRLRTRETILEL